MHDIYTTADEVIVWLGKAWTRNGLAIYLSLSMPTSIEERLTTPSCWNLWVDKDFYGHRAIAGSRGFDFDPTLVPMQFYVNLLEFERERITLS